MEDIEYSKQTFFSLINQLKTHLDGKNIIKLYNYIKDNNIHIEKSNGDFIIDYLFYYTLYHCYDIKVNYKDWFYLLKKNGYTLTKIELNKIKYKHSIYVINCYICKNNITTFLNTFKKCIEDNEIELVVNTQKRKLNDFDITENEYKKIKF